MVFNVTRSKVGRPPFKLIEEFAGIFPKNIYEDIETTPVGHANTDLFSTVAATALYGLGHHWNEAFPAFQAKTLCPGIFGGQRLFKSFGFD